MHDLTSAAAWGFPVPIYYGPGCLGNLASICLDAGMRRPLIVTDRGSAGLSFVAKTQKILEKAELPSLVFSEIDPNPTDENIFHGKDIYESGEYDGVVALGGGSGMDAGKAIALIAGQRDQDIWEFDLDYPPEGGPPQPEKFAPLICIPTTAGTGAETESTSMIIETSRKVKRCVWHADLKPHAAILDPELTLDLPLNLTTWTGCDALVHAIEAYSVDTFHPLCDGAALEGLRLIGEYITRTAEDGSDLEARGGMLVGSCLAGISFIKGLGLVHAMAHMIGAVHNTHHGLTNAVLLPTVLRFNKESIATKIPQMASAMGFEDTSFDGFYSAICGLLDQLDIPKGLSTLGVTKDSLQEIATKAHYDGCRITNPRPSTPEDIELLLNEAFHEGR